MIVIVMGVSGCGKSSVGRAIAQRTGWTFIEGDDLHPQSNRAKMASGIALGDEDRWPWLDAIADTARNLEANSGSVVIACSALKEIYRDRLARAGSDVKFIHLDGDRSTILERMRARTDHFMPPGLLDSQFSTLEPPAPGPLTHVFDISSAIEDIAQRAVTALGEAR